jgi:hypothetical protein
VKTIDPAAAYGDLPGELGDMVDGPVVPHRRDVLDAYRD